MNDKLVKQKPLFILIVTLLLLVTLGCLCLPSGIIPTSIPPTSTQLSLLPPVETEIVGGALNAEGPWLLIETDQGLWATNPDGSGLTQLTDVDYWDYSLPYAIQPGGNLILFYSPANYDFHHMSLNLLSPPDGNITKITDLTSPETEAYADMSPGDDGFEALRAVRDQLNFVWSPDGTRLAFVGAMDGPTAEIYIYEPASGEIQRVSQDDDQDYWPSWSPDGQHLLYLGAEAFGTGAGYLMSSVWLADGDGANVTRLYEPDSAIEEVVGWLDNTTVVLNSWNQDCGRNRLRLYDVVSRQQQMLFNDCLINAGSDAWRGAVIYATENGLYLLTNEDRTPTLISEQEVGWIETVKPGEYFFTVYFNDGSLATYGTSEYDHQVSPIVTDTGRVEVAMYGLIWGWTSEDDLQPGAWITGPGVEIGQIFDGKARLPTWDMDNNLLFFAAEDGSGYSLYRTTFSTFYQDLTLVNFIPAEVISVAWLGQ